MKIELNPWNVPNFVIGKMPPGRRQDGFNPDAAPKWTLAEVDVETLVMQCDRFRDEVFRKAGKSDPAKSRGVIIKEIINTGGREWTLKR
jgi:hypothetical protein